MLSKEQEADLLPEHRHSDLNSPRHKSHAVMLVDLPRLNILPLQVDRLHKVPAQSTRPIDPRTLPMIKSSSPLVDSSHRSLNEGVGDLLLVDSNETDPFDELLVKPIYLNMPISTPERRSAPDLLDLPVTTDIARSRPGSRDFTFAGGIAPPPLVSPPPEYTSPTRALHSIPESMSQSMATAAEILSMDASGERYDTPFDQSTIGGPSSYFTPGVHSEARSTYYTPGEQRSTTIAYTAQAGTYDGGSAYGTVPQVQITQASASHSADSDQYRQSTTTYNLGNERFESLGTSPQSIRGSQYTTARETVYTTPGTHPDNASSIFRDSVSSYQSAPPPVPSKYATASERSGRSEPIRYQLHDPDVQWGTASQGRSGVSDSGYQTARPPTTRMGTAEDGTMSYAYRSAMSTASPRSTGYETAPPPPISRSSIGSEKLSFRSDEQEQAETGTYISEPESDVGLLADLDRRSSNGSVIPIKTRSYHTAAQSGRTPLGTAQENTMYLTARDTAYSTAVSTLAEVATARGTQE
jgi:hypothetical protein